MGNKTIKEITDIHMKSYEMYLNLCHA